jgi:UDP-N-acetylglucosamine acyltransferase
MCGWWFTRIGEHNEIFQFASVGEVCQDLKYKVKKPGLKLVIIIKFVNIVVYIVVRFRITVNQIGSHNLLMVNTHIAHDCVVGDHNIFANNVGVAGHVHIGDYVVVGGNSGIHQFCKIDSYSMMVVHL